MKRAFDTAVSLPLLAILAPVMALTALAIRADSRGPIIFRQARVGRGGKEFTMLKFRSMVADAEQRLNEQGTIDEVHMAMFKPDDDARITRVGRFIRRYSLDELPQLINVLKGDMSLVGPRPEKPAVVQNHWEEFAPRLAVRPGITGPMQVLGRARLTFAERAALEVEYVEQLSFARDVRLLVTTVPAAFRGMGAF
jgi:lipopolysaccharide/colanic/teichoic acid biosynthesis glycosyltransferase